MKVRPHRSWKRKQQYCCYTRNTDIDLWTSINICIDLQASNSLCVDL